MLYETNGQIVDCAEGLSSSGDYFRLVHPANDSGAPYYKKVAARGAAGAVEAIRRITDHNATAECGGHMWIEFTNSPNNPWTVCHIALVHVATGF